MSESRPPFLDPLDRPVSGHTEVLSRVKILAGKYKLGRLIGEGGMGAVYEAEHLGLGAKVAVKVLSEANSLDPKALTRFRREARAMGAIRHENVVAVMDTGEDDAGVPFLVMEILHGESLATLLRRDRVLSPKLAVWISGQILSGLAQAHSVAVIHRDLKPGNVFIAKQPDGSHRVKIVDFGISKFSDASAAALNVTADGALVGTPNFMAPEQITNSSPLSPKADLYAVGVLLYRMVTGRLPYVGNSADELYRRILHGDLVPPRRRQPEVPHELEAIILRAMHVNPDERFPDAASFRAALAEIAPTLSGDSPPSVDLLARLESAEPATSAARPSALKSIQSKTGGPPRPPAAWYAKRWVWIAGALSLAFSIALAVYLQTGGSTGNKLVYAIKRYSSREDVSATHRPLAQYLSEQLGRTVELKIAEDDQELAEWVKQDKVDFAALSPYGYVRLKRELPDLHILAKPVTPAGASYKGIILTRVDSGIRKITDLVGKTFCYVQPNSTSGYLYPRALMRQAGVDPDKDLSKEIYGQDHLGTLRLLDRGACDAAAVYANVLEAGEKSGIPASHFVLVASTEPIPYDAYCAGKMSPQLSAELQSALLALSPGREAAISVFGKNTREIIGFTTAADSDYDPVRKIEHLIDTKVLPAP